MAPYVSKAVSGFGTLFKMGGDTALDPYATVAEVKGLSGPSFSADTIDVTHLSSEDGVREFIASLIDAGELTFDMNFVPSDPSQSPSTGFLSLLFARTKNYFQIVFPTNPVTTWTITGFVTGFEINAAIDDVLNASVTIKITAKPVFTTEV